MTFSSGSTTVLKTQLRRPKVSFSSGSTTVLKTQLRRPKVSFGLNREMTEKENDPLPIVELKPFVHKVWRREKSLPSFYDRSSSVNATAGSSSGRQSEVFETVSEADVLEETSSPPPRTAHSLPIHLPSQRTFTFEKAFQDFKSQKEHFSKFVVDNGFKPKSRLHPQAESINRKQPVHAISLIPGSFTRDDRERTTIVEISYGDSLSRSFSCSPKAVSQEDVQKQQQIHVKGQPVTKPSRHPSEPPSPSRSFNGSWHSTGLRHGSPASMLFHSKPIRDQGVKRPKTPLYDLIDRKGALPSLQINSKSLKKRHSNAYDPPISEDYEDYRDAYEASLKAKVGGIENSLKILNQHGAPTKVERQITFELEQNLSRLRKTKDYSPFEINPTEIAKFYSPPNFNMTQGEAMIRLGLHSNASRRQSLKSRGNMRNGIPLGVSRSNDNQFARNMLRKTFGRLDELPQYQNDSAYKGQRERSQTNMTVTTDEDLQVPHDTPRSRMESQMSLFKQTSQQKVSIAEVPEVTRKDTGMVTDKRRAKDTDTSQSLDNDNGYSSGQSVIPTNNNNKNVKHSVQSNGRAEPDAKPDKMGTLTNGHGGIDDEVAKVDNQMNGEGDIKSEVLKTKHVSGKQEMVSGPLVANGTDVQVGTDPSGRTFITSDNIAITQTS